jgi:hypothetical protein
MGKGATIPPAPWSGIVCKSLAIPDDPIWVAVVTGLLQQATKPYYWNSDTGDVAAATEQIAQTIYTWNNQDYCQQGTPDAGDCITYSARAGLIGFAPQNPYIQPDYVPPGYTSPPFYYEPTGTVLFPGLLPDDVITDITRVPLITLLVGYPRFRVSLVGSGTVELHLLAIPLGGNALVTTDDNPLTAQTIDLHLAIEDAPPETDVERIHEITFTTSGAHHIDVTFLPNLNPSLVPISYGGGVRSVVLCGTDIQGVYATQYRIDPTNGCVIQISEDGGLTWSTFLDVGACIPTPPDLSHFLIDNPSTARGNNIVPSGAVPGINIHSADYPALIIDNSYAGYAESVSRSADGDTTALVNWHNNSTTAPFLQLQSGVTINGGGISVQGMFRAPELTTAPTIDGTTTGGLYILSSDSGRIRAIVRAGLFSVVSKTIEFLLTLVGTYRLLTAGTDPAINTSKTGDTWSLELALPPIPLPDVVSPDYHQTTAGSTPEIAVGVAVHSDHTDTTLDLRLPPIPLPDVVSGDYHVEAAGSTPEIAVSVAVHSDHTDTTLDLRLPPIPLPDVVSGDYHVEAAGSTPEIAVSVAVHSDHTDTTLDLRLPPYAPLVPDNTLPLSGAKHFTGIEIDAFGSTLPFLIPAGYVISNVATRGLWYFQRFLEAGSKFSDGVHTPDHDFPYYTDLVAQATAGTADADGFYAAEGSVFNLIAAGFTATEDCYLKIEQSFQFTDGERKGEIYLDFDIAAPAPEFAWAHLIDVRADPHTADVGQDGQYSIDPVWVSGEGWKFEHPGHSYLTLHAIGDGTTVVKQMRVKFSITVTDGTDGSSTTTGEARCDASFYSTTALTGYSGEHDYIQPFDNTDYTTKQPIVGGCATDGQSGVTLQWHVIIHELSISGNGTEPTWSKT